jgi:hypothetical protein
MKGRAPVSSWYITTPAEKISARQSTVAPVYCSGAM